MIVSRLFKKTLLIMVVLFGLLAAAISLFSAWTLYSHMRTEYESKALAIAESMSQSSAETFVNNQATRVQSLINQFLDVEGVAYVFATTESVTSLHIPLYLRFQRPFRSGCRAICPGIPLAPHRRQRVSTLVSGDGFCTSPPLSWPAAPDISTSA
jgi:sensor histidine kinase regulating citrate/malate metabolism